MKERRRTAVRRKQAKRSTSGGSASDPAVVIIMGSDSDAGVMEHCTSILKELRVRFSVHVASAHRTPDRVRELVETSERSGASVFICGAGGAAHLGGVVAAHSTRPVIGVPIDSSPLGGLDALLATVMMPGGVPVATVAVGPSGARNAGLLAAQMIALSDAALAKRLIAYRAGLRAKVAKADQAVRRRLGGGRRREAR